MNFANSVIQVNFEWKLCFYCFSTKSARGYAKSIYNKATSVCIDKISLVT